MSEIKLRTYSQHPARPPEGTFRIYILASDRRMYLQSSTTEQAQDGVDFNGLLEKLTYERADKIMISDSNDSGALKAIDIGTLGGCGGVNMVKFSYVTSNWSPTIAQIEETASFYLVDTDSGDIQITLPEADGFTDDGAIRRFFFVNGGTGKVTINISNAGTFPDGLDKIVMNRFNDITQIGGFNKPGVTTFWGRINQIETNLQINRTTDWNASNFTSPTAIPFETIELEDNDSILNFESATPTRVNVGLKGSYRVNYNVCVDSIGGQAWSVDAWIRKNGTIEITNTRTRIRFAGGEITCLTLPTISIDLDGNDYIELMVQNVTLTGSITGSRISLNRMA